MERPNNNIKLGKGLRALLLSLLAGLLVYGVFVVATDRSAILAALVRLDSNDWLLVLGLSLLNYCLRYWRWQYYLRHLTQQRTPKGCFTVYLAGFALTTTPGKAGEALRSIYLKPLGVGYTHSLAALFVERVMDLLAIALLAALIAFYLENHSLLVVVLLASIVGVLLLLQWRGLNPYLEGRVGRLHQGKIRRLGQHFLELLRASGHLMRALPLYVGLFVGIIAWGAEGVALYVIAHAMDVHLSVATAVGVYAIAILAGALSFLPGGLGSTEAVMGMLLIAVGSGSSEAVAATLVSRVTTLWFAVAIGLAALVWLEWGSRSPVRILRESA